ncbi:DUF4231 domain-containing protein [Bacillus luteolus]|uniref:DUF4231 domain-containing protein n=1 Tax=Litchfieldia luteola TaxID=682179 RepID=A0ABR9QPS2_9BACI|nr:DUF4231 domain-containing protein [Cytobacillus luteolus]MBE4910184.1 DUF4231 domain-containing protein [Cytobacillus luteolus]MBP1942247.1 hypothetical protein [Cytobacillus luteolus]
MSVWTYFTYGYLLTAILTFYPTLKAILRKVKLHPGGESFDKNQHFSEQTRELLTQHYSRIQGTLIFWKNQAEKYRNFHYYCLCWTIPSSITIPILIQSMNAGNFNSSSLLVTIISSHTAILLAFHRGFKVDKNFKSFRHGESEFYDLYRRLLDRPSSFGKNEIEQIENYFIEVETIRKFVRNAETDNMPSIEDTKAPNNKTTSI